MIPRSSRRQFTRQLVRLAASSLALPTMVRGETAVPSLLSSSSRPRMDFGVACGDVGEDSAVVWSRADRAGRMVVEWSTDERFRRDVRRITGPVVGASTDHTGKVLLRRLPAGQTVFYRVQFEGRGSTRELSDAVVGRLRTASREPSDVYFAWSGDTCGQGYGIDASRGGLATYRAIHGLEPDFLVHSGDLIYADNPIPASIDLPDGTRWRNLVTAEKSKVAETLAEFHGNYRYPLQDPQVRECNAHVPVFAQWDDHEVRNNWYPGQKLAEDDRYVVKDVDLLAARARQAFFDYQPVRPSRDAKIYRVVRRGPLCDLFFLDLRSYRSANNTNRQPTLGADSRILGENQWKWITSALRRSTARWKIVCCDMPLGLNVGDTGGRWEAVANGDPGAPLGRELEIAELLKSLKRSRVRNVLWLTADVHYAAAHHYDPARAVFTEFDPFWEFVSGPLHAGSFGPGDFDRTFGPEVRWRSREPGALQNLPPSANQQYFGTVRIAASSGVATVTQYNRLGERLWSVEIPPV
ncbi:MAG: alkaline phosphatase D family protein [Verrucomicrobiales bacterium]|nr:alkaline phosphatase D family protein [Verrucomicrobiales bacterium]